MLCTTTFTNQGENISEDILLVSKWLNVGMDPIQGVDQRHGTLWTNT
jgi:hypothetical protein